MVVQCRVNVIGNVSYIILFSFFFVCLLGRDVWPISLLFESQCSQCSHGWVAYNFVLIMLFVFIYFSITISFTFPDKHKQQQVILQARAKAPLIRMEGQYSQGTATDVRWCVPCTDLQLGCYLRLLYNWGGKEPIWILWLNCWLFLVLQLQI